MANNIFKRKPFLTYDKQIDKLINEKGLIINDIISTKKLLKKHGYFALISGYKQPFKSKNGLYKKKTSIEDIFNLYTLINWIEIKVASINHR